METSVKIMVVDDEMAICKNVEKILSKNRYQVVCAESAQEALEKMAKETFSLLISDIVMPGTNGLELLRLVKKQWPLTKALIMTAYASTDTAVRAVRLGALDYIPKPFTPDELRQTVQRALAGELMEAPTSEREKESIDLIDVDIPFSREEVAKQTGEAYVDSLGPSDMPVVEVKISENVQHFCQVGEMVCDIFKKLGATCKAGTKSGECPRIKARASKTAAAQKAPEVKKLIGIDMPFDYDEVVAVTGPEYIRYLDREGVSFVPYEELKKNMSRILEGKTAAPTTPSAVQKKSKTIDVDIPFSREEVAKQTGEAYVDSLGPSDMPVVEVKISENVQHFCQVGEMVCDIFKKLGATCKAGTKSGECPRIKARASKTAAAQKAPEVKKLIGIDMPFDYDEVVAVTGPEYVRYLDREGVSFVPYEELKENVARMKKQAPARRPSNREVLVIDDEVAVNNNIRRILTRKGYRVLQAMSKSEALEKIREKPFQLVILDLKIPGVKGFELLRAIREQQPAAMVIIVTGYASIETAVEGARMGAIDYLSKPFTPDEIRNAADTAIRLVA